MRDHEQMAKARAFVAHNFRMTDIQATMIAAQINNLDLIKTKRRGVRKVLEQIPGLVPCDADSPLFNIVKTDQPLALIKHLSDCGIEARQQYELQGMGIWAEDWHRRAVFLPFGQSLTAFDAQYIVDHIMEWLDVSGRLAKAVEA